MDPAKLEKLFEQQLKLMEMLTQTHISSRVPTAPTIPESVDGITSGISEFLYDPDANITFDTWFRRYEDLFKVDFVDRDDSWKVRLLLRKLGPSELDKYCNFILPQNPRDRSFDATIQSLSQLFGDHHSLFSTRYRCLKLVMNESDDFLTHVGVVNRECERFKLRSLTEDQFKSLILICSLQSPKFSDIRTRLLNRLEQDPTLTLNAIIDEYQRIINLQRDTTLVQSGGQGGSEVHAVQHQKKSSRSTNSSPSNASAVSISNHSKPVQKKPPSPCWHCGAWHYVKFCPFKQHVCDRCQKVGHKSGFCKSNRFNNRRNAQTQRRFHKKPITSSRSLAAVFHTHAATRRKFLTLSINGQPVRLQLDTASDITILSKKTWRTLGQPPIKPSSQTAVSACGGHLRLHGELCCCISFRGTTFNGTCYITDSPLNLLGLDWFEELGLADLPISAVCNQVQTTASTQQHTEDLRKRFIELFKPGLGLCSTTEAVLKLQSEATPVFRPKRPVPYASLPLVDAELQRLETEGVLVPVSYSSWAAPIVVVKKSNGSIRICADFSTGLNAALQQHHYPLPIPDDLFTILNGGTYFAKLDLAEAYLQIPVALESRELLTINTHRGLFQYTRLPFGIKTAPAIFQQIMDTILADVPGVATYLDDVLIVGSTVDELHTRTHLVLQRLQDNGFRLRPEKCQFFLRFVKYLGFIFDASGRHPDPQNTYAIQQMPAPTDVSSLRSFLGMISYYSAFLPSLHDVRYPLNRLLEKNATWNWSTQCESAFSKLKAMLSSNLLLTHYNPKLPIVVAADASTHGLGAVISHVFPDGSEKAVMHASRTLTPAEKRYGQIEKEALALIFAVRRFHKFIYGRRFTLLTDHKPLLSTFGSKKGIPAHSANRLQRWALALLGYDFDIQYRRSEDFGQADALSRLISNHSTTDEDTLIATVSTEEDSGATLLANAVRAMPVTAEDVREATREDPIIQEAITYVQSRWPVKQLSGDMQQPANRRSALCIVNDCLMFGDRVVIPTTLRSKVLRQFHSGHPGINRMKSIARSYAYWPNMDKQIVDFVKRCSHCQKAAKNPPKLPPVPWPKSEKPWSRVHIDFTGPLDGTTYLILVDSYSKWPEILPIAPPSITRTIKLLNRIFAQHGLPEAIVTDNGSQFTSSQFRDFRLQNSINHVRSPPYHPQSNGQAERFVDTFKRAMLKARGEGTTEDIIERFLVAYRTTPHDLLPNSKSPAEMLMGRKLRTVHGAMKPKQVAQQSPQMKNTRIPYEVGTKVYARDYRHGCDKWVEGEITQKHGNVMYDVKVNQEIWTRHHNQLRSREAKEKEAITKHVPLDLLLDTFQLPPIPPTETTKSSTQVEHPSGSVWLPRRSDRKRRHPKKLQVNPRLRRY
ncbi:unnamed protein product [Schistosoma bovis]|nr:unnamed protein product [Schistosoma bovis]